MAPRGGPNRVMSQARFCSRCGSPLQPQTLFCGRCGAQLRPPEKRAVRPRLPRLAIAGGIGAAVAVLLVVAVTATPLLPAQTTPATPAPVLASAASPAAPAALPASVPPGAEPAGELRLALSQDPEKIDPQRASFTDEVPIVLLSFRSLFTFDPATLRPVPDAAQDLPRISSDGLTFNIRLRRDQRYSDGRLVRAEDFGFGFRRLCDPGVKSPYAFAGYVVVGCQAWSESDPSRSSSGEQQRLRDAVGVRALDDSTIEYRLREPAPYFTSVLGLWATAPTRADTVGQGASWTEPGTYVGNGPYRLASWRHDEQLVFERSQFHQPLPPLRRIVFNILGSASAFNAYRNNELDVYRVTREDRATIESDSRLSSEVLKGGSACTEYLGFDTRRAPFDDPRVRLALAKAIDRSALVAEALQGFGAPAVTFIPPGLPGHDSADDSQSYDPQAAASFLHASRYAPDSLASATLLYTGAQRGVVANELRRQWTQTLGVAPKTQSAPRGTVLAGSALFLAGWCADYPDPQNWLSLVFRSSTSLDSSRRIGYASSDFDTLTRAADRESDGSKRGELYRQAQRLLTRDAPAAFLYNSVEWYLLKRWVGGYTSTALGFGFPGLSVHTVYVRARTK